MSSPSPTFHPRDDPIERRLARARRKRPRSLSWLLWVSIAVFVAGLAASLVLIHLRTTGPTAPHRAPAARHAPPAPTNAAVAPGSARRRRGDAAPAGQQRTLTLIQGAPPTWDSPTSGRSLDLRYLPAGSHLIVSFRPAAVLASPTGREVVKGLGPAAATLLGRLGQLCGVAPAAVEHVVLGWIPTTDGRPPRVAAAVRLAAPMARSALLQAWGNPVPVTEGARRYYTAADGQRALYVADEQTFAVAPPELLREVVAEAGRELPVPRSIESLLPHSDLDRHLSLIFDTEFLRDDARRLFPNPALPLVEAALAFLGDEVPGGIISVHLAPELFAELAVSSSTTASPRRLGTELDKRLQQLPYDVRQRVSGLRPRRGGRLVGRFPAMIKALAVCTSLDLVDRVVVLRVLLPERAGPNLAWAGPLVVEADRANSRNPLTPAPADRPLALAERLARPITVGFRRTPLRAAVGMISEESGIAFEFMMKDLEAIGVTGNIPQEGEYREVPPAEILDAILTKLGLVYVVNQGENKVYITSRKAAIERGQIPADK